MDLRALFSHLIGQGAEHVMLEDPSAQQAVRLLSKVQMHLFGGWRAAQSMGIRCRQHARSVVVGTVACTEPMAGTCVACRQPVCLEHAAFVPGSGDLICFGCIGVAQRAAGVSGPSASSKKVPPADDDDEALRKKYLKRLKLTGDPSEDEIRAAFKREAAKAHPDRAPEGKKDKAHARFVALGEARDWLLNNSRDSRAA